MKCSQCRDLLDDYLRGYLDGGRKSELADHLARCRDCAKEYDELKSLMTLMAQEPQLSVAAGELDDFLGGVWRKIHGPKWSSSKDSVFNLGWSWRLVFSLAAAAILSLFLLKPPADFTVYWPGANADQHVYTESDYMALIDALFDDDELVILDLVESELYTGLSAEFEADPYGYLERLDDEGLRLFEEELSKLLNRTG